MAQAGRGGGGAAGGQGGRSGGAGEGKSSGAGRDGGTRDAVGTGNGAHAPTGNQAGRNAAGAPEAKSWGRQISDIFGGPTAYAANPNRPNYDTSTMGVPIDMPLTSVFNAPVKNPMDAFTRAFGMMNPVLGGGMMATRGIQSMTGMSGGPSIGGRDDGMGAFGGGGGTANAGMGMGGALRPEAAQAPVAPVFQGQQPQIAGPVNSAPLPVKPRPLFNYAGIGGGRPYGVNIMGPR